MDESTDYNVDYTQGLSISPNNPMSQFVQPSFPAPEMNKSEFIPVHRKIHINPSVLLPQHHENHLSISSYSSWPPHTESWSVQENYYQSYPSSRYFRKREYASDRHDIYNCNEESRISSRGFANLFFGTHYNDQHHARRNDDIDEAISRKLTNREKIKRTVDARLWLQAKYAKNKAKQIVKTSKRKNSKTIRLEVLNKTFINRATSPIVFEPACKSESVGKRGINQTELELLASDDDCQVIEIDSNTEAESLRDDDDDCQVIEIDSKTETELLRDDDDDNDCLIISSV